MCIHGPNGFAGYKCKDDHIRCSSGPYDPMQWRSKLLVFPAREAWTGDHTFEGCRYSSTRWIKASSLRSDQMIWQGIWMYYFSCTIEWVWYNYHGHSLFLFLLLLSVSGMMWFFVSAYGSISVKVILGSSICTLASKWHRWGDISHVKIKSE